MTFGHWKTDFQDRIYINGLIGVSGKTFFQNSKGKALLKNSLSELNIEEKEMVFSGVELILGVPRGEIDFNLLVEKINSKKPQKRNESSQSFSKKTYGSEQMLDRKLEASRLELNSIKFKEPVKIRIDHREPQELIELISSHPEVEVSVEALPLGDIIINEEVIIERKNCATENRTTDFEASIIDEDKRLFYQSERLKIQNEYVAIILLEGDCHKNSQRMKIQAIDGALSYLAVIQGVSTWSTYNIHHSAYTILKIATHSKNGLENPLMLRKKTPELLLDKKAFVLEGIPGINYKLARKLIENFGTIKNIAHASEKELKTVKGLGDKKISSILEAFN